MSTPRSILSAPLAAAVAVLLATPASAAGAWTVVPSADSTTNDDLGSVSILSSSEAWAAGSAYTVINGTLNEVPLTEHYTGGAWKAVPTPAPAGLNYSYLNDVVAISASDVWAVGMGFASGKRASHALAEHYDGTAWSIVPVPQPYLRGDLSGLAARSSTDVWAVGSTATRTFSGVTTLYPLAEHYDGSAWSVQATPALVQASLTSVTEISPTDVWAVGSRAGVDTAHPQGLVLHYDGTAWAEITVPAPAVPAGGSWQLSDVTSSGGQIWAVGTTSSADSATQHSFVLHGDGTSWSATALPLLGAAYTYQSLYGIAAASPTDVWVTGSASTGNQTSVTLAEHYDGTGWSVTPTPSPAPSAGLAGVATDGSTTWSVGSRTTASGSAFQTLVERFR